MKLLVTLTLCAVCLDLIAAKSNSAIDQDIKIKSSPKINSLSTTPKPDNQFLALQQQQQQQYRQQIYPQQPAPPQYQQIQPQRQIHGQQQIFVQPTQIYQSQAQQLQQAAYQSQLQAQQQPQLQQVFQKAYIVPQQQNRPPAMIFFTQPTYVPQNVLYTGAPNQLVNYIHGSPQARYQFLQGNNQGQAQPVAQQTPAHTIGNYQVVAVPAQYQQNLVAVPAPIPQATHLPQAVSIPVPQAQAPPQPSPLQLAQIAHIASQQYSRINPSQSQQQVASSQPFSYQTEPRALQENPQAAGPVRSIPPIITGFENFTPEQQEKIKVQLSAYFGAPLRPLPNSGLPANSIQGGEGQGKERSQYSQGQESRLGGNEFIPSPSEQVKGDASTSSSNVFKSHYARV
ncbi:putative uncharacterized protein DDB_G0271606 [Anoplophora glabripennis]|uniref:putative uncharacterized protein DDB_G0271606 n=1 Tax=Anoplophora glabripennis TaxID=217634 RepID=UPI0008756577|nr:putative uncharacterized protein DDB_G0271606 [Anoplophora glabripennis]